MIVTRAPWTRIVASAPSPDVQVPGIMISTGPLADALAAYRQMADAPLVPPAVFVLTPDQVKQISEQDKELLGILKSIAGLVLGSVDKRLKTGIDGIWLVYGMANLRAAFKKPKKDWEKMFFTAAGLGMSAASLLGNAYPDLRLGDPWANGINFALKNGQAVYEGKTPPINELVLSQGQAAAVVVKLMKYAGVTLDPDSSVLTPAPVTVSGTSSA